MSEIYYPISEVVNFIRKTDRRGLCFGRWPNLVLEIYLQWHYQNGNLVIELQEGNLVAVAIVTEVLEDDFDQYPVPWDRQGEPDIQQDSLEKEEWSMETEFSEYAGPRHRGLTVFALESVFNKISEGVK